MSAFEARFIQANRVLVGLALREGRLVAIELLQDSLPYDTPDAAAAAAWQESEIYGSALMQGAKVDSQGNIYVSTARWGGPEIPATLSKLVEKDGAWVLEPYPSAEMNAIGNPAGLKAVLGFEIDRNDVMWILDQGHVAGAPSGPGDDKLVLWDIKGNKEVQRYAFTDADSDKTCSFLNDVAVDNDTGFAYITDSGIFCNPLHGGLIAYDSNTNTARRVLDQHLYTNNEPDFVFNTDNRTAPPSFTCNQRTRPGMPDIVCLGEPMLEFNQNQEDGRYLAGHGGDTSNCAIAAARAGASVGYLTRIGADEFGDSFLRLWQAEGVDTATVARDPAAHTGIYFVTHTEAGHAFSYFRTGSAASRMGPADVPEAAIAAARVLHVSGISQAISDSAADAVFHAIDVAAAHDTLVSYDTNLRLKLWPLDRARAVIHAAMARCDIALPGLDDARQLTGRDDPDTIADFYLELGAGIVALTLGPEGTLVATPDKRARVPGIAVAQVDAMAAGDTFDGAFLAEYLNTDDPFAAARFANAAAGLSTQGYGAVAPMPRRDAVLAALAAA